MRHVGKWLTLAGAGFISDVDRIYVSDEGIVIKEISDLSTFTEEK